MSDLIRRVTLERSNAKKFDNFKSGDTVGVHVIIKEGAKKELSFLKVLF